ncbi:MAG: zinc-dependent alcohol dehydrogenase family protein [Pseudomonadota bacterium]|nr:zinc-dependent alcohol dehydrogenase family protein [Pseudomonadota bacterium]
MARIVRFNETGGPEVLKIYDEPLQEPGDGEVRLKVEAMGLNRAEIMFRDGKYAADPVFPSRIGIEGSGTIDAIGSGVSDFKIGDKVAAIPFLSWDKWGNWTAESVMRYGIYGESAVVPAYSVAHNPDNILMIEAAAIWCQYLTAWGGVINYANLASDDIALITAASSSAGLGGLQIANLTGATTIAVTRTAAKKQFLLDAGADHVVVTDDEDLRERVMDITGGRGFSVAYDPVGGEFMADLVDSAQPCGTIVNYGNLRTEPINVPILPMLVKRLDIKFHSLFDTMRLSQERGRGIKYVMNNVASGALRVIVDKTFTLEEIVDAHRYMESNAQMGKIVVTA